jgi:hypothetical protein
MPHLQHCLPSTDPNSCGSCLPGIDAAAWRLLRLMLLTLLQAAGLHLLLLLVVRVCCVVVLLAV